MTVRIKSGRLNRYIRMASYAETAADSYGDPHPSRTWSIWGRLWAEAKDLYGQEGAVLQQTTPGLTRQYRARWQPGIVPEMRLLDTTRTKTQLSAALSTTNGTAITVDADLGVSPSTKFLIEVDSELMRVTAGHPTTSWTITRGEYSTTAATHLDNSVVRLVREFEIGSVMNEQEADTAILMNCSVLV